MIDELIGLSELNCLELLLYVRSHFGLPLPDVPPIKTATVREKIELLKHYCSSGDRSNFDLCLVGTDEHCSLGTHLDSGILFLGANGRSRWQPIAMVRYISGAWTINPERYVSASKATRIY